MRGSLSRKTRLIKHHRLHTREKPYIYSHPESTKRFTKRSSLVKHLRIHTSENHTYASTLDPQKRLAKEAHYCVMKERTRVRHHTKATILNATDVLPEKTVLYHTNDYTKKDSEGTPAKRSHLSRTVTKHSYTASLGNKRLPNNTNLCFAKRIT